MMVVDSGLLFWLALHIRKMFWTPCTVSSSSSTYNIETHFHEKLNIFLRIVNLFKQREITRWWFMREIHIRSVNNQRHYWGKVVGAIFQGHRVDYRTKFQHITPILKSLHWLKVSERNEYKIISFTYKILNTTQPSYLYDLVSIQPPHGHNTRSSPYVTLIKPSSSLKVTHRSFRHASPHLWNQPIYITQNSSSESFIPPQRPSFEHAGLTCYTLLSPSITFSLFHSELKTHLFRKSYPPP